MKITISGLPGSGKSTVARTVAKRLGYEFYSVGDLRGQEAQRRGLTLDQFNALPEDTDAFADDFQKQLGQSKDDIVVDGRLAWHFVPDGFNIFLDVAPPVGADRVFAAQKRREAGRGDEANYRDVAEAEKALAARVESDIERYRRHYGIDFADRKVYDLVIDTSGITPEETVERILAALSK